MHIAIVTAAMAAGGAERVIAQLLGQWCKDGIRCTLITMRKEPIFYEIPKEVELHEIGKQTDNHYLNKLKQYKKLRSIVREIKPDIVLSLPEEIGIYVIGALLGTKIPVVVSERNNPWVMPNKKPTRILRRLLYPFAKGFVFQTKQAASFFSKRIQKKGIVLSNPLDLGRIPAPYTGEREKVIAGAGRLEPQKNFPLLIDAFAKFYTTHTDYTLRIYGDGTLREELEAYAASKLPANSYEFMGRVSDLPQRINSAAAFVLSSDFEGVPNVLIEALAMGVPSVSVDCAPGGAAELIEHGVNGFLVPVRDLEALAHHMCEIIDSPVAQEFSVESLKIKERMDATVVCRSWLGYLEGVLNKGKR